MNLLKYPHPMLTRKTQKTFFEGNEFCDWAKFDPELINRTKEALYKIPNGLALAANQIGIPQRFFVIRPEFAQNECLSTDVFINPTYTVLSDNTQTEIEGCLSFPGINLDIERYYSIECSFDHEDGTNSVMALSGLAARVFQHECEHLDGETFLENLPRIQRYQVIGELRKRKGI